MKRGTGIILTVLFVFAGALGFAAYWIYSARHFEQSKVAFLDEYRWLMHGNVYQYYLMFGELPSQLADLETGETSAKPGWVLSGLEDYELDKPSLAAAWESLANQMLAEALAGAPSQLSNWKQELKQKRSLLTAREGDLSAQLDVFINVDFEPRSGAYLLRELEQGHKVKPALLDEFTRCATSVRMSLSNLVGPLNQLNAEDIDMNELAARNSRLRDALEKFERARQAVVNAVQ